MKRRWPKRVRTLIDRFLDTQSAAPPTLRRAVLLRAARACGLELPLLDADAGDAAAPLGGELDGWAEKVADHAADIDDAALDRMRRSAGDEPLFDLTIAAALGASLARFDRALALIEETP